MADQIRRTLRIGFPVEKIERAIVDTCQSRPGRYQIRNCSEALKTYNLSLVKNLYVLAVSVSLLVLAEDETEISFSAMPGPQLGRMPSFTASLIDDFLNEVGDRASGKISSY